MSEISFSPGELRKAAGGMDDAAQDLVAKAQALLGEVGDVSALGTNVLRVRIIGMVAITLLAGSATALTGGIAFIGLMVPHVVRWFVGPDQRWILTFSALGGAVLTLVADIVGRIVMPPAEIEAGVLAAVIGAPMLIALVRRGRASGL